MDKKPKIIYPEYKHSIVNLMASIQRYYNVASDYEPISEVDLELAKGYTHILLMVFDGLGSKALEYHLEENAFLRNHVIRGIQSVYPPTTTAAMTSYYTGLSPGEHGWLGWSMYFKECSAMVDLFTDHDSKSGLAVPGKRIANSALPYTTVYEKIHEENQDKMIIHTIKPKEIIFPHAPNHHHGVSTLEEMEEVILKITRSDLKSFTAAYWPNPDLLMHEFGPYGEKVGENIDQTNDFIKSLAQQLDNTLIIVSADHGQTEITREIKLEDNRELSHMLIMPPSVEGRSASFFVKEKYRKEFRSLFNKEYGEAFELLSHEEVITRKLFGLGKYHKRFDDFIGDYVACATDHSILHYKTVNGKIPHHFLGHHAGLTEEEMMIPLIMIPCHGDGFNEKA